MHGDSGDNTAEVVSKFGGNVPVNIDHLNEEERHKLILKMIEDHRKFCQQLEKTALDALNNAIDRAKKTQQIIVSLNIAMFFFGVFLLITAAVVGMVKGDGGYAIIFGGVGLVQIIASFFVGSMERSQKAISDLVQIEIAYLSYFEQVNLWELYAGILDSDHRIDQANLEKAADKIQACTKTTLELLQINIESKTPTNEASKK
ncbi:MAG: hypothetical protein M0R30_10395 [Methanoregula sp.]|jgi:hypothetical protein|nr:hypothetical protein [Methanoregula sp.]